MADGNDEVGELPIGRPQGVHQRSRRQLNETLPQNLYRAVQLGIIDQLVFHKFEGQHHGS